MISELGECSLNQVVADSLSCSSLRKYLLFCVTGWLRHLTVRFGFDVDNCESDTERYCLCQRALEGDIATLIYWESFSKEGSGSSPFIETINNFSVLTYYEVNLYWTVKWLRKNNWKEDWLPVSLTLLFMWLLAEKGEIKVRFTAQRKYASHFWAKTGRGTVVLRHNP